MGVLMPIVDRVIVLDHGEKIFEGSPTEAARQRPGDRGLPRQAAGVRGYAIRPILHRHARACPGHPRLAAPKFVDGRDKSGHDGGSACARTGDALSMLQVSSLSAGYGSFRALFEVSLEVDAGETVAVIGPNGAGKTHADAGDLGHAAEASEASSPSRGRRSAASRRIDIVAAGIAHVPENRRLFPRLSVEENLRMGAFLPAARAHFAERRAWVFELFPRLRERRDQLAGTLSGGEQQMCAIARALMSKPTLLLLDEPSAGLAPLVVQQVFDLVRRIADEGFTVLIVEQNVQQVLDLVDRAYLLEAGRIALAGTADEAEAERRGAALVHGAVGGRAWTSTSSRPS